MIKRIIVTYDFSDETFQKVVERFPNRDSALLSFRVEMFKNKFDQQLFGHLRELGVEVEMITHEESLDVASKLSELEEKLRFADLVFHDTTRVAYEMFSHPMVEQYQKAIEDLVHSKFLGKSHFESENIRYSGKREAAEIAKAAGFLIPKSWSVDEYFASGRKLPVILKLDFMSCGKCIYFINKKEQMDKFFDEKLYSGLPGILHSAPDRNCFIVQDFIECPSNYFTNYRLFTLGDGSIVAAVLNRSRNRKDKLKIIREDGPFSEDSDIYNCVDSPLYMRFLKVVSNYKQGGIQIPFNANNNSRPLNDDDKSVLIAHGYDPEKPVLNHALERLTANLAREFSKYGILFSGQDWMQDMRGNFYFLELHQYPGMQIFNTLYNKGEGDNNTAMSIGIRKLAESLREYGRSTT